ncbi:hypothetical protein TSUD_108140 [Trifolium subterraneum]|uniref:Uncharacterized protein n=1 Tax=Trifolium subterraneum TaxID=3900 RepID=A0A2Z6MB09_TRISU|nr:hypothetical protein TSUD_108140 [Trifolium subterraneum]
MLTETDCGRRPMSTDYGRKETTDVRRNRWSVGNGASINIMNEPWLRGKDGAWLPSPQAQGVHNFTVNDLMLPNVKLDNEFHSVLEVIHDICSNENKEIAGIFAMLVWVLWNNENESGQSMGFKACQLWEDWLLVQKLQQHSPQTELQQQDIKWQKSSLGWYNCNVDAGFHKERNKTSTARCLRDHMG